MKPGAWIALAAALPVAAQPKLPPNARLDTRSAAAGLDREFQAMAAATQRPAWIADSAPSTHTTALGCEFVSQDGTQWSNGTVHLESPAQALILFRVVASAVEPIRALSPYCEIDPGEAPFHWIADVAPAQSVALLAALATRKPQLASAVGAIAVHGDPAALDLPICLSQAGPDTGARLPAVRELGHSRDARSLAAIGAALDQDADPAVKRAGCSPLRSLPEGLGIPRPIQLASETRSRQLRRRAMASLRDSHDPRALAFFESVLTK